jgi:hypothetical protein
MPKDFSLPIRWSSAIQSTPLMFHKFLFKDNDLRAEKRNGRRSPRIRSKPPNQGTLMNLHLNDLFGDKATVFMPFRYASSQRHKAQIARLLIENKEVLHWALFDLRLSGARL